MQFTTRRFIAPLALASFAALAIGVAARGDDMSPPPPSAPAKPADPAKSADPAKPADPTKPADPAKPESPAAKPEPVQAPDFTLKDLDGKERKLSEFAGKWVVLEWTNYSCPFVKKHYGPKSMQATQKAWTDKGVVWLSICSSAEGREGYLSPEDWKKAVAEQGAVPTALLLDGDGTVGHLYGARTTPDMRVIDPKGRLVYTGAIDDDPSMKSDPTKAKNYVSAALEAGMAGKAIETPETKPYGCGVKYAKK